MARTFVPSEQLNFRSAATGTHLLDTYLEACEKGGVTLPILMENLYSSDGGLNPNALQFRVSTSSGTPVFQARFGHFTDADAGWFDTNQSFFHWRGDYATSTAYKRLDMVRLASNQSTYICTVAHTSTSTLDTSKFQEFFDGANITSVVGSLTNINAVAGSLAAINTLAPKTSQLDLLGTSDAVAALTNVSGISGNVTTVAGISSSVTSAATNSTSISSVAGIASNVTAVAGIASNVTALAGKTTEITGLGTSANITNMATLGASGVVGNIATVAGVASTMSAAATNATNAATSASAAGGSATAAANSAAAAATALDTFDDRYLGSKSSEPSVDNDGNALVSGSLFFDSAVGSMKVFDGGNWILATSAGAASLLDYEYTATAGQTTFSGSDNNSATLSYAVGNLIVSLNGITLDNGSDYTATSGTSIVLASGAAVGDHLAVVAFKSFTAADAVSASTGGTFGGNVTVSGTVNGRNLATDGTKLDGIAAGATNYVHPTGSGNNHVPAGGATGQVLTYASAGTAAWVAASGGGEQTFTATGAITAGQPVGINSNGTISTSVVIKSSVQRPTLTNSLSFFGAGYDVAQNKYLLAGRRGTGSGTSVAEAVVATLSGNTFSFGTTQTEFEGFEPYTHPYSVIYDAGSQKNLVIWTRQDNRMRSRVGTISGTSVSFGSTATAQSGTGDTEIIFAASAGNNKVVSIARHEVGSAGNYYLWATVHTISGTSVSMSSPVDVSGATMNSGGLLGQYGICYDSNAGKVVVFYVVAGNTALLCKIGTISGSSISFGSAVDTGYDMTSTKPKPVFDPSTNKVLLVFADSGNFSNSKALVGTVSGTSISFAANPTEMGSIGNPKAVYNSTNSTIVLDYGSLEVVKLSGTTLERDRVFTYTDVTFNQSSLIYDDDNQSTVIMADQQGDCITIKTASPKFTGLAKENIADGATGKVTVTGGINTSQSGLVSGFDYGLPSDSATLVSGSNNKVGVALSASSILVTEGSL